MKIYLGIRNISRIEGLEDSGTYMVNVNTFYLNCSQTISESLQMLLECENFAIVAAYHFIDSVAEKQSAVEVSRFEFLQRDDFVLY